MTTIAPHRRNAARGFSLVEVMVAIIVISIGMLGVAKMQGLALSSTGASRSRALAAIEASSLAAAMQANRSYWSATGTTPMTVTVATAAGAVTSLASGTATMQTALSNVTPCGGMGTTSLSCYCTGGNAAPCLASINVAASDLYDWANNLANFLPSATASVTCNPADTPEDCTINIQWNENTVALTSQEAANSTSNGSNVPVSYTLYVVP